MILIYWYRILQKSEQLEQNELLIAGDSLKQELAQIVLFLLESFFRRCLMNSFLQALRVFREILIREKINNTTNPDIEYDVGKCKTLGEYANKRLYGSK